VIVDMSLFTLISQASLVVKLVMLGLLSVSVMSWVIIFNKTKLFKEQSTRLAESRQALQRIHSIESLQDYIASKRDQLDGIEALIRPGLQDYLKLQGVGFYEPQLIQDSVQHKCQNALHVMQQTLEEKIPFLASVGSVSPYVGLFGTVWGIMSALRALGGVSSATISMVAPGMAEALIATALGLFVAIPAVIFYNRFSHTSDFLLEQYEIILQDFYRLVRFASAEAVAAPLAKTGS
jgi:biopolymer transport protein TolQ